MPDDEEDPDPDLPGAFDSPRMQDVGPVVFTPAPPACPIHGLTVPCAVCDPAAYKARLETLDEEEPDEYDWDTSEARDEDEG